MKTLLLAVFLCFNSMVLCGQIADRKIYLNDFVKEMNMKWPKNRTLNIVFHGHSVPSGYALTPKVNTLHAYPHLVLCGLKEIYSSAVLNVITTSIGGEQSEKGAWRFEDEVLPHRPDVLFVDYALNDRSIGLERSEKAWRQMIEKALAKKIKIILLTPTPDLKEDILSDDAPLLSYANMIKRLATEYKIGLVDSYACFKRKAEEGEQLKMYMSQNNHPNAFGHSVVANEILPWFF